jgi:hypothetical protein
MLSRTENRFTEMKDIHSRYFPFMEDFLNKKAGDVDDLEMSSMIKDFAIEKIASKPSSRSHLMYQIGRHLGLDIDDAFFFVCASLEMCMVQAYCYNVGADGKSGYVGQKKGVSFRTAEFIKDSHFDFIDQTNLLSDEQKSKLQSFTKEVYMGIYIGQSFDTLINIYDNFNKKPLFPISIPEDRLHDSEILKDELKITEPFLVDKDIFNLETIEYFLWERVYGLSGHMNSLYPKIFANLFLDNIDSKKEIIDSLEKYSFCYGMLLMIVNDIQDFALDLTMDNTPTREKILSDAFIDIRNERITHPIMNLLKSNDESSISLLKDFYKDKNNTEIQDKVREDLVLKGYIRESLLEASAYAFIAKDSIKNIKENEDVSMLEDTVISLVKGNKYVKLLTNKFDIKIKPTDSEIKNRKESLLNWLSLHKEKLSSIYN